MNDNVIIQIMQEHFEGLFPKVCTLCGRRFATLKEYILNTKRIGATIFYDAELENWETTQPIGAVALANCACGTTLALTTGGMPISQMHLMLKWIKEETQHRGMSSVELADYVRDEIHKRVLEDIV